MKSTTKYAVMVVLMLAMLAGKADAVLDTITWSPVELYTNGTVISDATNGMYRVQMVGGFNARDALIWEVFTKDTQYKTNLPESELFIRIQYTSPAGAQTYWANFRFPKRIPRDVENLQVH